MIQAQKDPESEQPVLDYIKCCPRVVFKLTVLKAIENGVAMA